MITRLSAHSLEELSACAKLALSVDLPLVFSDVFAGAPKIFTRSEARRLFEDDSHRNGELYPGHSKVCMVLDQALVDPDRYRSLPDALALQEAGGTIMFRALHLYSPRVRMVCKALANAVNLPVHAVGYWAPPASQGFPLHADPDSVLAVHALGYETWAFVLPRLPSLGDEDLAWVAEPGESMTSPFDEADRVLIVGAGQVLFVPRGWGHCAVAEGVETIHVSFGVLHPEISVDTIGRQSPVYPVA